MSLTIEEIRAACEDPGKTAPVEVPEWIGTVHVRLVRGFEYGTLRQILGDEEPTSASGEGEPAGKDADENPVEKFARVCQLCLSDAIGTRVFCDSEDDFAVAMKIPVKALKCIAEAALDHNGLGEGEDEGEAKNP